MNQTDEAPRRGRPSRTETAAADRRRRKTGEQTDALNISDEVRAKFPDMDFRWARDDEGRIAQLTQNDDWDTVPDVKHIHAGVSKASQPISHVLLMKPKAFIEEDRNAKLAELKRQETGLLPTQTKEQALAVGQTTYAVPGNKIAQG